MIDPTDGSDDTPPKSFGAPQGNVKYQCVAVEGADVMIVTFDSQTVRNAFVRRVFAILTVMLSVVTLMGSSVVFVQPMREFIQDHWYISIIAWIPFLIVYFVLACVPSVRKKYPINMILLGILTVTMGFVLMGMCATAQPEIVVLVFLVTTISCIAIILLASFKGCCDVTKWGFIFFAALFAAILFSIFATIIGFFFIKLAFLNTIICGIFCVIFMGYLAYDTQLIMGGRRHELQPDEYVMGAMQLFLDITMIFMYMLGGIGGNG